MMVKHDFVNKLKLIPAKPGIYLYLNAKNEIIYIGKSKLLNKRIKSYFINCKFSKDKNNSLINIKITDKNFYQLRLLNHIYDFDYIITNNEAEALILEYNLIKKYNPYFNIMLTDDKRYPYFLITKEKYPRILYVRKFIKKNGYHFGPLPDGFHAKKMYLLLNRLFPFRKCNKMPKTPCIYYYLNQCLAPCVNKIDPIIYQSYIKEIKNFLLYKNQTVIKELIKKRDNFSKIYQYEQAKKYQELIHTIENYFMNCPSVEILKKINFHALSYIQKNNWIGISLSIIINGKLINQIFTPKLLINNENLNDAIVQYLYNFYKNHKPPLQMYCQKNINFDKWNKLFSFPFKYSNNNKIQKLIEMGIENANVKLNNFIKTNFETNEQYFKNWLYLKKLLKINEFWKVAFIDNSHLSTKNYVSGIQIYQITKYNFIKQYKKSLSSNVKNDIAAFINFFRLSYEKLIKQYKCDIIFCDGGKAQVNGVKKIIDKLDSNNKIYVLGLIKNEKHQTQYLLFNNRKINLTNHHNLWLMLQNLQNKIHNYVFYFNRKKNNKTIYYSSLIKLPGIGEKTAEKIMKEFSSDLINNKKISLLEIKKIIKNNSNAEKIFKIFNKNNFNV